MLLSSELNCNVHVCARSVVVQVEFSRRRVEDLMIERLAAVKGYHLWSAHEAEANPKHEDPAMPDVCLFRCHAPLNAKAALSTSSAGAAARESLMSDVQAHILPYDYDARAVKRALDAFCKTNDDEGLRASEEALMRVFRDAKRKKLAHEAQSSTCAQGAASDIFIANLREAADDIGAHTLNFLQLEYFCQYMRDATARERRDVLAATYDIVRLPWKLRLAADDNGRYRVRLTRRAQSDMHSPLFGPSSVACQIADEVYALYPKATLALFGSAVLYGEPCFDPNERGDTILCVYAMSIC